jgi:hypothetical protein
VPPKQNGLIGNAKSFFLYDACSKNQIPPNPPFPKGGTYGISFKSPPLKKGDLGGFKNHQSEGIFGKRYKYTKRRVGPGVRPLGGKG